MNWSDYVVIGLIAGFAIYGMYKGFILSVYKLVAFFACIYVSIKFSPVVAAFLKNTSVFSSIKNAIARNLPLLSHQAVSSPDTSATGTAGAEAMLGTLPLPGFLKQSMLGNLPSPSELINTDSIVNAISDELAMTILSILSLILLYIILRIVTAFIGLLLKGVSQLPLFKQVNKLGGFILGGAQGILAVYILCAILVLFNANPKFSGIFNSIGTSMFAGGFYDNNFIINWLFPPVAA
ncbi:MAG TPA: CvpA family protein [Clostridia bacterium]|nr:CvpA family protein [Clostridia bacterium]